MGLWGSKEATFEEHLQLIAETWVEEEEVVARFRRSVSRRTSGYRDVQSLFEWQQSHQEESMLSRGCVADLTGAMWLAIKEVKVNRVDVF